MKSEVRAKVMLVGARAGRQSLERRGDETRHEPVLCNERDRQERADRGSIVGRRETREGPGSVICNRPADATECPCVKGRNGGSSGESDDASYRATLEAWLPSQLPGRRSWAYLIVRGGARRRVAAAARHRRAVAGRQTFNFSHHYLVLLSELRPPFVMQRPVNPTQR